MVEGLKVLGVVVTMGVDWVVGGGYWEGAGMCRIGIKESQRREGAIIVTTQMRLQLVLLAAITLIGVAGCSKSDTPDNSPKGTSPKERNSDLPFKPATKSFTDYLNSLTWRDGNPGDLAI